MKLSLYSVLTLAGAAALLSVPSAEAQQVIKAANGQCVGVSEVDGVTLVLTDCFNRGTVIGLTVDSYTYLGPIRVTTSDGRAGCLDAYRGGGGAVEAVACDGTPEQNWDLSALFTNAGMSTCIAAGRGGGVLNASCDGSRRQQFFLETLTTADLVASPAGSFGSGVAPTSPTPGSMTGGGGSLIGNDAGSLVGQDGASLVGQDGASVVGHNGGALIGADGSTLIGNDAGSLVGQDGASLLGNNSNNLNGTSMDGYGGIVAAGAGNALSLLSVEGECRDPWVTQAIIEVTGSAPTGSGESGDCYIGNYNNGSWGSYEELKGYVQAALMPGFRIAIGSYCLDATGSQVTIQDCSGSSMFDITSGQLRVAAANTCIDAYRGAHKVGYEEDQSVREPANVVGCDGTQEQNWTFHETSGNAFFIKDDRFGLCLDVDGGVIAPGRSVLLWKCYDAVRPANQIFSLVY